MNIRKFIHRPRKLANLVDQGSLTPAAAEFLDAAVASGAKILISGATQAGKTTMLNALAGSIPARERIIYCEAIEDTDKDAHCQEIMKRALEEARGRWLKVNVTCPIALKYMEQNAAES